MSTPSYLDSSTFKNTAQSIQVPLPKPTVTPTVTPVPTPKTITSPASIIPQKTTPPPTVTPSQSFDPATQQAMAKFKTNTGNVPNINNPTDKARILALKYPDGNIPASENDGSFDYATFNRSLTGTGSNNPATAPLNNIANPTQNDLNNAGSNMQNYAGTVQQMTGSQPGFMNALSDAVRTKNGYQNVGIGQSPLYDQLGIKGIGALMSSLQAQGSDINDKAASFSNMMQNANGLYNASIQQAAQHYNEGKDLYNMMLERFQKAADTSKDLALSLINQGADIPDDMKNLLGDKFDMYKQMSQEVKESKQRVFEQGLVQYGVEPIEDYNNKYNPQTTTQKYQTITNNLSGLDTDQQAQIIADAIKQQETGGVQKAGASGEMKTMYQFLPSTWNNMSEAYIKANPDKFGGKTNLDMIPTPENEDKVAKWQISQWLSEGMTPDQIASMWNHGQKEYAGVSGEHVNPDGTKVHYDTPAYVDKVMANINKGLTDSGASIGGTKFGYTDDQLNAMAQQYAVGMKLADIIPGSKVRNVGLTSEIQKRALDSGANIALAKITNKADQATYTKINTGMSVFGQAEGALMSMYPTTKALIDKMNSNTAFANMPINFVKTQLGNADAKALQAQLDIISRDLGPIFAKGGDLTEGVRKESQQLVNGSLTPSQFEKLFETFKTDVENNRASYQDQLNQIASHYTGSTTETAPTTGTNTTKPPLSSFEK